MPFQGHNQLLQSWRRGARKQGLEWSKANTKPTGHSQGWSRQGYGSQGHHSKSRTDCLKVKATKLKSTGQAVTHNNSKQNWSTKQLSCNKFRRMDKLATEVRRNNFIHIFIFSDFLNFKKKNYGQLL